MRWIVAGWVVLVVAGVLSGAAARADESEEAAELRRSLATLREVLESLEERVRTLEDRLRRIKGVPSERPAESGERPERVPPAAGAAPVAPADVVYEEELDRFTGELQIEVVGPAVWAEHKDDPGDRIEIVPSWHVRRTEQSSPEHVFQLATRGAVRRWSPTSTVVYMLIDGERMQVTIRADGAGINARDEEYIRFSFAEETARRFAEAESVEMRAGVWELAVPSSMRDQVARALDRAKSGGR